MAFNIEGADEFSQFNIPQNYDYNWDMTPWIESPLSFQGNMKNPYSGSNDDLASLVNWQPQYDNLDITKYRYDPFGGYMQYMDKAGKIGYMQGTGKQLGEGISMAPNMYNEGLTKWKDPNQSDWFQMNFDPYGINGQARSPYKIREDVGQGWFSKNMDWLVPGAIGLLGGGLALSGVGMNPGAAAGAVGGQGAAVGADTALGTMAGGAGSVTVPAVEGGLGTLPAAGTWANTAAPVLGASAGEWTLPAALASEASLAGGAGAMSALPDIYGPPTTLANPGVNPLSEFAGPAADLAGKAGGGSLGEIVTEAIKKMGSSAIDNFTRDPVGVVGKLVTAVLDNQRARSNEKANSAQQERYEQGADPFGPERDYYQGLLKQSYDNPYALKDSPEYSGLGRIYQDQIARRDAAKGRNLAGELPRDIEMQDHFMKWLGDYRQGLQQAAGSNINPNGVYASFLDNQRANQAASSSAYGGIPYALGKIFDPYANEKQSFTEDVINFLKGIV